MNAKVNKAFFCILILIIWTAKHQYYRHKGSITGKFVMYRLYVFGSSVFLSDNSSHKGIEFFYQDYIFSTNVP